MAYENNKKFDKKDNKKPFNNKANNKPKNLHTSVFKYAVVSASTVDISAVMSMLQSITYDLISIPITLKTTTDKGQRTLKVGYVNGFEAHLEGEEFKLTILAPHVEAFKAIKTPIVKILVRTDRKTGEPVQVLGFEIADDSTTEATE